MYEVLRFGKTVGKVLGYRGDEGRTKEAAVRKYGKGVTVRRAL